MGTNESAVSPGPPVPPVPEVARRYRDRLRARFGARLGEVRLFGSYARGGASEHSDVDVLVVVDDLSHAEKIEAIELGAEVALGSGLALSPLVWSQTEYDRLRGLELGLALDIEREGVPV